MTYDVDTQPSICYPAEKNMVWFNGIPIEQLDPGGTLGDLPLRGANRAWVETTYLVPISAIRFPASPGAIGPDLQSTGTPSDGYNFVHIWSSEECRCHAVGWISLEMLVSSPVVLLHGIGDEGSAFWDPAAHGDVVTFTNALSDELLVHRTIDHFSTSVRESADLINRELPKMAKSLGVDSFNLIAHSKGGLDGIYYLAHLYDEDMPVPPAHGDFQVVSFTTLSSPLMGSVLADIAGYWWAFLLGQYDEQQFPLFDAIVWGIMGPFVGDVRDLQVNDASRIVNTATWGLPRGPDPPAPAYNTVSADLDQNNSGWVSCFPDEGFTIRQFLDLPDFPPLNCALNWMAMNFPYRTLRTTAWVYWDFFEWKLRAVSSGGQEGNDILVTVRSGQGGRGYRSFVDAFGNRKVYEAPEFKTHGSVADEEVAQVIIPWLQARETTYPGDLRDFRDPGQPLCP